RRGPVVRWMYAMLPNHGGPQFDKWAHRVHTACGARGAIYADRPGGCRTFLCGWLTNRRFGPGRKPYRSQVAITVGRSETDSISNAIRASRMHGARNPTTARSEASRRLPFNTAQ